jgi:hypothetical protein
MRILLLYFLIICQYSVAFAQASKNVRYKIVQLPATISNSKPGIKQTLNSKIANVSDKAKVFQILNDSLKGYKNLPVKIREQLSESSFMYYAYFISSPTESFSKHNGFTDTKAGHYAGYTNQGSNIFVDIKGSRTVQTEKIYTKIQLKQYFSDTIVIIDTLQVNVIPRDFNYRHDGYFLLTQEANAKKISLYSKDNYSVMICRNDFANFDSSGYIGCNLFNEADAGKAITGFKLRFLNEDEKVFLRDMALLLKEENAADPEYNDQWIAEHIAAYIKASWGNAKVSNIIAWLKKQFQ